MVDLVDSIRRKLERNDNSSQGSNPQLLGPPQITGALQTVEGLSDCRGPLRLLRVLRIAETPILLGAHQIAGPLRLIGPLRLSTALQIAESPSDCWGSLGLLALGPLRLLWAPQVDGALRLSGTIQIAEGPSDC